MGVRKYAYDKIFYSNRGKTFKIIYFPSSTVPVPDTATNFPELLRLVIRRSGVPKS